MPARDFIWLGCANGNHKWQLIGGANAGCSPDCACSVPVHECSDCKDCDYGKNAEATEIKRNCTFRDNDTQSANGTESVVGS